MSLSVWPAPPTVHSDLRPWLEAVDKSARQDKGRARRRAMLWAWGRLFTFAAIPIGVYLFFGAGQPWGGLVAAAGAILFTGAVRQHEAATTAATAAGQISLMAEESLRRVNGEPMILRNGMEPVDLSIWQAFFEQCEPTLNTDRLTPQEIDDLDVFGERLGVFGLLNRTSSPAGASRLAHSLIAPPLALVTSCDTQAAIRMIAEAHQCRVQLLASASLMRPLESACGKFLATMQAATPIDNEGIARIVRWWGLAGPITLFLAVASSFGWITFGLGWMPFVVVLIINAIIIPNLLRGVRERLRPWLELEPIVAAMRQHAETAAAILPEGPRLIELRRQFAEALTPGGLVTLHRRIPLVYLGLAGILHTIIDVFCFWDLQVLLLLERCTLRGKDRILGAIAATGELEMLCSLAAFSAEQPGTSWPVFEDGSPRLSIREGRHPLVAHETAVANSLELGRGENTWLITGSNMSGKSTLLRMAGVNVLLARIGSAVCAENMTLTPLQILTDLRIRDDLSRKESYFLAEVRQVRRMVETGLSGQPMLALIDEPFRGTNSAERVAAAGAVISSLMRGGGLHLVATHDAALARIVAKEGGANYHFEEQFEQNKMVFDYQLRPGPAKGRNALRVLEGEKYPAEVIARAHELIRELGESTPAI